MAEYAYNLYCNDAKIIDLENLSFPICDGNNCYEDPIVGELKGEIINATSIFLGQLFLVVSSFIFEIGVALSGVKGPLMYGSNLSRSIGIT